MADLLASNVDLDSIGVVRIVGIPSKRRDTFVIDPLFSPTSAYLLDGLLVEGLAHYIDHVRTGNICRLCAHRSPPLFFPPANCHVPSTTSSAQLFSTLCTRNL